MNANCANYHTPQSPSLSSALTGTSSQAEEEFSSSILEELGNSPSCDDCDAMARALSSGSGYINVGGAGTAMRFLAAYFAMQEGREVVLDGDERMRQRPIGPLVDALRQMGAKIDYVGDEGFPPLHIVGQRLSGGEISVKGDVSSQYISALLMIAPLAGGMTLHIEREPVSRPYIDMTLGLMRHYGIDARWHSLSSALTGTSSQAEEEQGNSPSKIEGVGESMIKKQIIVVPEGQYVAAPLTIEGDWSAASYWFALQALLPQSAITLKSLSSNSLQGDSIIVELMKPLGVKAVMAGDELRLSASGIPVVKKYDCDMKQWPDLVPTMAVTLCLLDVPFTLRGLRTLAIKESNRAAVLCGELAKLGYVLEHDSDSITYSGMHCEPQPHPRIDPHGDHRMAMAMALAATRHPGLVICDAQVVTKSYPQFWQHFNQCIMQNA